MSGELITASACLPWRFSATGAHFRKGRGNGNGNQQAWQHVAMISASSHQPKPKKKKKEEEEDHQLSTFSSSIATDLPLYESHAASFDQYLSNRSRVFQAMFPDKQRSQRLNDDEWRIQMLPLEFLFLTVRPLVDIRLKCKSQGKDYPPKVPLHISRVLELEVTRWELRGIDSVLKPSHFALGVQGALYSERQGIRSRLKGQLEMSISCILPRALSLLPDDVLRSISESALKKLVENMKQNVNERLLSDFRNFRREQLLRQGKMAIQPEPPNQIGRAPAQ